MDCPISGVRSSLWARHSTLLTLAAFTSSTVLAARAYAWWKTRNEAKEDEELFETVAEIPLDGSKKASLQRKCVSMASEGRDSTPGSCTRMLTSAERDSALKLTQALLGKLCGEEAVDEEDSNAGWHLDTSEVSLNYHIAVELERNAHDSLTQALVQVEMLRVEAPGGTVPVSSCIELLKLTREYFESSKAREELRELRSGILSGNSNPSRNMRIDGIDNGRIVEGKDSDFESDIYSLLTQQRARALSAAYEEAQSRNTEMDKRLGAPEDGRWDECLEMDWGDEDEADLMMYLDQDDGAGFCSRAEARKGAQMQRELQMLDEDYSFEFGHCEEETEALDDNYKAEFECMLMSKLSLLADSLGFETDSLRVLEMSRNGREASVVRGSSTTCDYASEDGLDSCGAVNVDNDSDAWETESTLERNEVESLEGR
ncbi:hypothetical protein ERJ75_000134300 [Trypanosoma vivax]|uniref:Uncharacterized protein n=1 Tax=Trypanosoma vivax (strain Y486) TaxID=1055687 RepID=G0TT24_TRYVY|nr:hypothetical protein TRVL_02492 [Trypanosoma vivax]KAH8619689.1 hypothetical protein ERJ75_000134300 [Trypanosoma vivax]CCC47105.1 conserved hypothetical protein [Trypanosoma vivax Y486]